MRFWMDVMRHLEPIMDDYERLFAAWEAAGVDGIALGPPFFRGGDAVYQPNPAVYRSLGVEPPPPPTSDISARRRLLEQTLTAARDRGWTVWLFQPSSGAGPGGPGHHLADEQSRAAVIARVTDALQQFPMVHGAIMDGPEWGYEIDPHHLNHRSYLFHDLPESLAGPCAARGYDYQGLVAAKDRLYQRLHALTPAHVEACAGGGLLGAFQLFGQDPDLFAWLRFRSELLTEWFRAVHDGLTTALERDFLYANGPRTAAFGPLCGYDVPALAGFIDVFLPKHYFWHRGFDGLYGTVYRYVRVLTRWSPTLGDRDALLVVAALFGLELPGVETRRDFDAVFPQEFFDVVVTRETRRALAAVGDPDRVAPWVDAGRKPHDGDPITAGDLRRMLTAAREAGLRRFMYHHHENLTHGEWAVLSDLCGTPWEESPEPGAYAPPDRPVL